MATPRAAIGTLLKRNGTTVALVSDINGPGMKGDTIDVTNHDNPDNYKQFIVGLKEGGDVKAKIYFDPAETTHTDLISAFEARSLDSWAIVPPVAGVTGWTFTGVLTQFDSKFKVNGPMEADITIKVSGKPTWA
jgi:predicted secreted protein